MNDNSIDSVVTDPPYGLSKEPDITEVLTKWLNGEPYDHGHGGFMGKEWDSFVPHPDIWKEVFRVLKPGGHALVFAGTPTQDLMTVSLRIAGFEVRDVIEWIYFSGFPKSHDVGKAFDRRGELELSDEYTGWGTNLKPAHEPIIVVRKPFKGTVAGNVEEYGTGAINVDASRIGMTAEDYESYYKKLKSFDNVADKTPIGNGITFGGTSTMTGKADTRAVSARFPANCITLDSEAYYAKYFNVAQANISPEELSKKASKKDRNSDWQGEEIGVPLKEKTF